MNSAEKKIRISMGLGLAAVVVACLYWSMEERRGVLSLVMTADQQAMVLFRQERFAEAADLFDSPRWKAVAHYRDGRFKDTSAVLSGDGSAEGAYNQANALCMLGKYSEAVPRYEQALAIRPDWDAARMNLEIARAGAERLDFTGGEMTGGKLAADEYVFSDKKSANQSEGETEVIEGEQQAFDDARMRAVWLRGVQTQPSDFLRSKFAYQAAMKEYE